MVKINLIDKKLEQAPTVSEALKVAQKEKDPMTHIELELMNRLEQAFSEARESGFTGSFNEWLDSKPVEELKELGKFSDGGPVDFSSMSIDQLRAIFRSETGRDPKNPRELVRVVRLWQKGKDEKGVDY